ncbi:MAG: hypothetical protein ACRCYU_12005 [Nocardioides sp.]
MESVAAARVAAGVVAAGAVVATVLFVQFRAIDEVTPPPPPAPSATATAVEPSVEPTEPSGEPSATEASGDVQEAASAASKAILVYSTWSYTDSGPDEWLDRLAPLSEPGFIDSWRVTFGDSPEVDAYWKREVLAKKIEARADVLEVNVSALHDQTEDQKVFTVFYEISRRKLAFDDAWSEPAGQLSKFVTVNRHGDNWLIYDIDDPATR